MSAAIGSEANRVSVVSSRTLRIRASARARPASWLMKHTRCVRVGRATRATPTCFAPRRRIIDGASSAVDVFDVGKALRDENTLFSSFGAHCVESRARDAKRDRSEGNPMTIRVRYGKAPRLVGPCSARHSASPAVGMQRIVSSRSSVANVRGASPALQPIVTVALRSASSGVVQRSTHPSPVARLQRATTDAGRHGPLARA